MDGGKIANRLRNKLLELKEHKCSEFIYGYTLAVCDMEEIFNGE